MMTANKETSANAKSTHARVFDASNTNWSANAHPDYNLLFLQSQQNYFNDVLLSRGHVFLNEIYDALGFKRTSAGQIVGWLRNGEGVKFIDFNIDDRQEEKNPSILLDFNVDGVIYDKIEGDTDA